MRSSGFEDVLQENHDQAFGLRRLLSRREQLHVKVMRDGLIEAEIEPPPEFPFAHLNQTHSYSAHAEVDAMLRGLGIGFRTARTVPKACLNRVVVPPRNPTHWLVFAIAAGAGIGTWLLGRWLDGRRS